MTNELPDFQPAPNQGSRPDLYELENQAIDPGGLVLAAMRKLAPWEVLSRWQFRSRADFENVLGLEFPGQVAGSWLAAHPGATGLSYGYVLFTTRKPG